ncbi:MAG: CDP-alcohol phosphatidyltransferase family protein [Acidimicrobiales bacterium]
MFDGSFRTNFEKVVSPIGSTLNRVGVSPDLITALGVAMAAGCAVAIGTGNFRVAFLLLVLTGLPDALDGAVAKAGGTSGPRGAYFDSVSDRLSDGLMFAGAGWYLAGGGGGYDPRMALLPFGLYIAASLVSYQRAKAESLGFDARGGLMERAERFVVLGLGLLFNEFFVPVLWLMLALTAATAAFRFVKVWKQASVGRPMPARSPSAARRRQARAARRSRRSPVRSRRQP